MTTHRVWTTRTETAADIPSIREIDLAAFPTPHEADLMEELRADESAWIEGLSVVATDEDDRPVGHAVLTRCHVDAAPVLCLGPVAVLPGRQRTGAGSAAVRGVLRAAEDMGEQYVVVLGHPDYYPRFGFTRASVHGITLSIEAPDEAVMVLALRDGDRMPRGTVRWAAPFGI